MYYVLYSNLFSFANSFHQMFLSLIMLTLVSASSTDFIIEKCIEFVPGWHDETELTITSMLEGLSNLLFKVSINDEDKWVGEPIRTVLFRVYGESVSSFYEPDMELEVFKTVSEFGIGPKMYANDSGWRIEEYYIDYKVIPVTELSEPSIYLSVARQLASLHSLSRLTSFPPHLAERDPISIFRLEHWTAEASKIREIDSKIIDEVNKMSEALKEQDTLVLGFHKVFSHNDLQENNLLRNEEDIKFIDFEYADMNFQGADIGNFFNEFTINYLETEFPMYSADPSQYPSVAIQREFVIEYLKTYLERVPNEFEISELLSSVSMFSQLSDLLWGMWAIVRSAQKAETDFGFLEYAQFRFDNRS